METVFAGVASLLQSMSVCVDICQPFLSTQPWLTLLLSLAANGPLEVQRRALRVLHRVLPVTRPTSVHVALPSSVSSAGKSESADALLAWLLACIGRAVAPVAAPSAVSDADSAAAAAFDSALLAQRASEVVSLLRRLLQVRVGWRVDYCGIERLLVVVVSTSVDGC